MLRPDAVQTKVTALIEQNMCGGARNGFGGRNSSAGARRWNRTFRYNLLRLLNRAPVKRVGGRWQGAHCAAFEATTAAEPAIARLPAALSD